MNNRPPPPPPPPPTRVDLTNHTISELARKTASASRRAKDSKYGSDTDSDSDSDTDFKLESIFGPIQTDLLESKGADIEAKYDESKKLALVFVNTESWRKANITENISKGGFFKAEGLLYQTTILIHTGDRGPELSKIYSESLKAIKQKLEHLSALTAKVFFYECEPFWDKRVSLETMTKNGKRCVIMKGCSVEREEHKGGQTGPKVVGEGTLLFSKFPIVHLLGDTPGGVPAKFIISRLDIRSRKFCIKEVLKPSAEGDLGGDDLP